MLHHIKKLQKRPEHVRERTAIFVAGFITLFIFVGWVTTLSSRLALFDEAVESQTASAKLSGGLTIVNEKDSGIASPAGIFSEKIGDAYEGFKDAVGY